MHILLYNVKIFPFRLKNILDDLMTITISDFKKVLTSLELHNGKGKLIICLYSFYLLRQLP